jgi:hypothetical protein
VSFFVEYLIRLLQVVAWPVTVFVLAVMFRQELARLGMRVSSLKYREFEARFDRELRAVNDEAKSLQAGQIDASAQSAEPSEYDRLIRIAEVSPRAAISEAWRSVELAAANAARVAGVDAPPRSPVFRCAQLCSRRRFVR